jgi:hypothetical protein
MWMNRWEIDCAAERYQDHPIATLVLKKRPHRTIHRAVGWEPWVVR